MKHIEYEIQKASIWGFFYALHFDTFSIPYIIYKMAKLMFFTFCRNIAFQCVEV